MPLMEKGLRPEPRETPVRLRFLAEQAVRALCEFSTDGVERFHEYCEMHPGKKFVIMASHCSELDAPAALAALGKELNIQVAAESVLFEQVAHTTMFTLGGKDHFTPIDYSIREDGRHLGRFNPDNFTPLVMWMKRGRTPWISAHPYNVSGGILPGRVGPVYLAQLAEAEILPVGFAIDEQSGFADPLNIARQALVRPKGVLRVGQPMTMPKIDVVNFTEATRSIAQGRRSELNATQLAEFSRVTKLLRAQANAVTELIAELLPDELRGIYR